MRKTLQASKRARRLGSFVVAYDISDDVRRQKLHDILLGFGVPVQYSVFECSLSSGQLGQMLKRIEPLFLRQRDVLAVYSLCGTCAARVIRIGSSAASAAVALI